LIDTLVIGAADLAPLLARLADPEVPCLVHGGEFDVASLKRHLGCAPQGIIDTQQAALLLGYERTGYGAMVAACLGIELPKGHSTYDWGTRPIATEALAYAVNDVRHLPELAAHLQAEITDRDLQEEFAIACAAVTATVGRPPGFDDSHLWRIAGVSSLSDDKLPILLALLRWREEQARAADQPSGRLLNPQALLQLARVGPTNFSSLKRLGVQGRFLHEHGREVLEVIQRARQEPPSLPARPVQPEPDPGQRQRERRLRDWRRGEAARRGVPEQAVLPARAITHLATVGAADLAGVPQLGPKRIGLYGATLQRLCS
jgi:ribonuclease D